MKVKNISKATINLRSGSVKPGMVGEATDIEHKLLLANGRIEVTSVFTIKSGTPIKEPVKKAAPDGPKDK